MFISEQYGWCSELSGDYFEWIMDLGYSDHKYGLISIVRDVDLMLMSL